MKYEGVLKDSSLLEYKTNIFMKTKYIKVNDVVLDKIDKNIYGGVINGKYTNAYVHGNIITGCEIVVGDCHPVINFPPKLLECFVGVLPFVLSIIFIILFGKRIVDFSNLLYLYSGLLGGIGAYLSLHFLVVIRLKRKSYIYNILLDILYLVITILIYVTIGFIFINLIK